MGRHDRAYGVHHEPGRSGKGHRGRRVLATRRRDSGLTKEAFEALLRKHDIRPRRS